MDAEGLCGVGSFCVAEWRSRGWRRVGCGRIGRRMRPCLTPAMLHGRRLTMRRWPVLAANVQVLPRFAGPVLIEGRGVCGDVAGMRAAGGVVVSALVARGGGEQSSDILCAAEAGWAVSIE